MSLSKRLGLLALIAATLALTGCGGVRGSYSASPASFILPGLDVKPGPMRGDSQFPRFQSPGVADKIR
jgi:hypothetical protein